MNTCGNLVPLLEDSSVVALHGNTRKCRKEGWNKFALILMVVAIMIATAEAQTFQYSRGWTNGKRSGGYGGGAVGVGSSPYDLETGGGMLGSDPLEIVMPGHLQVSLNPSSRFRTGEYTPVSYLVKRSANLVNTRKPVWIGTILGMDGGVDGEQGSTFPITTSNSSPANAASASAASIQHRTSGSSPSDF